MSPATNDAAPLSPDSSPLPFGWASDAASAARAAGFGLWVAADEAEAVSAMRHDQRAGFLSSDDVAKTLSGQPDDRAALEWIEKERAALGSYSIQIGAHFLSRHDALMRARDELLALRERPGSDGQDLGLGQKTQGQGSEARRVLDSSPLSRGASFAASARGARDLARELCRKHGFSQVFIQASCAQTPDEQMAALSRALVAADASALHLGLPQGALGLHGRLSLGLMGAQSGPSMASGESALALFFRNFVATAEPGSPLGSIALKPFLPELQKMAGKPVYSLDASLSHEWTHALDALAAARFTPGSRLYFSQQPPAERAKLAPSAHAALERMERAIFQRSGAARGEASLRRERAQARRDELALADGLSRSLRSLAGASDAAGSPDPEDWLTCARWAAWSLRSAPTLVLRQKIGDLFEMGQAAADFDEVDPELLLSTRRLLDWPPLRGREEAPGLIAEAFALREEAFAGLAARQAFDSHAHPSAGVFAHARARRDGSSGQHYWREPHELLASAVGRPANVLSRAAQAFRSVADTPLFTPREQRDLREGLRELAASVGVALLAAPRPNKLEAFAALAQRAANGALDAFAASGRDSAQAHADLSFSLSLRALPPLSPAESTARAAQPAELPAPPRRGF